MSGTKIMGVSVPVVTKGESPIRTSFTRGYAVTGVSSRVDETADKFERILDVIIEYADIETRLKRLGEEINKTNRRVNALEQITVPALSEQVTYISQTLDERAREDLFRLKKVKKKIEKKKDAQARARRALAAGVSDREMRTAPGDRGRSCSVWRCAATRRAPAALGAGYVRERPRRRPRRRGSRATSRRISTLIARVAPELAAEREELDDVAHGHAAEVQVVPLRRARRTPTPRRGPTRVPRSPRSVKSSTAGPRPWRSRSIARSTALALLDLERADAEFFVGDVGLVLVHAWRTPFLMSCSTAGRVALAPSPLLDRSVAPVRDNGNHRVRIESTRIGSRPKRGVVEFSEVIAKRRSVRHFKAEWR